MEELARRIRTLMEQDGALPRLHPNGFYTLDLSDTEKLHVWPDEPVRQRADGGFIHDHAFAFRSQVLVGAIVDTQFDASPAADGSAVYRVPQRRGRTHLVPDVPARDPERQAPVPTVRRRIRAGNAYYVPRGILHRTDPVGFTATWVTITDFGIAPEARVLIPEGRELQPFDRALTESEGARAAFLIGRVHYLITH